MYTYIWRQSQHPLLTTFDGAAGQWHVITADGAEDVISVPWPGGAITDHRWDGDTLHFTVEGLGQRVSAQMDVSDANVHCTFTLPAFLAMFTDRIRAKLEREAPKLLE